MKPKVVALALLLAGCAAPSWRVVRVIDGDTVVVESADGVRERVRLRDVNAPEMDEPGGPEAAEALRAKWQGRPVRLRVFARDRYGRLVAVME